MSAGKMGESGVDKTALTLHKTMNEASTQALTSVGLGPRHEHGVAARGGVVQHEHAVTKLADANGPDGCEGNRAVMSDPDSGANR